MALVVMTTTDLVRGLRASNPDRRVTEAVIRWTIRTGRVAAPAKFSNSFSWSEHDVRSLCAALDLTLPSEVTDGRE